MQQEALLVGAFQTVDELFILPGAERRHDEGLRFAAGKQRRAVRARQNAIPSAKLVEPSARRVRRSGTPVSRIFQRTTLACRLRKTSATSSLAKFGCLRWKCGEHGLLLSQRVDGVKRFCFEVIL